jgi:hypothetical protein
LEVLKAGGPMGRPLFLGQMGVREPDCGEERLPWEELDIAGEDAAC